MTHRRLFGLVLGLALVLLPSAALAQDSLTASVDASVTSCTAASFQIEISGGVDPYAITLDFGDGDAPLEMTGTDPYAESIEHIYPAQGIYAWTLTVTDGEASVAQDLGALEVPGPVVSLTSVPFPPLLTLEGGQAGVAFEAVVEGGEGPYSYAWDLDGDGAPELEGDTSGAATFTYTEGGKYLASVQVQDGCGLIDQDTLPVVIIDPEQEACHPTAQRIADAVNTLFPAQAESLYTCEDVYDIFRGGLTGSQVGFGRMWHAYKLAVTMEELTWEELRDWHLDGNGWGLLTQLDRYAEALSDIGLRELFDMVLSGEASIGDIRTAVRAVVRYEADFEDALARAAAGLSPGKLGQFYRTAQDLEIDPADLDSYLEAGLSISDLRHAGRLAQRTGDDWAAVAEAHAAGYSWGEIGQAQRLSGSQEDWQAILEIGVKEYRSQQREDAKLERSGDQALKTAERLAKRYGLTVAQVMDIYEDVCDGSWSCVRATLHEQAKGEPGSKGKGKGKD